MSRRRRHYLAEWAASLGLTNSAIVEATGADKSLVSRWLKQGSEPGPEYLGRLGALFGVSPERLYAPPSDKLASTLGPAVSIADTDAPIFAGNVAAGLFLPVDEYFQQDGVEIPDTVRRSALYPKARQYAYRVQGNSMDLAGIADGMWIVAADAGDYVDVYGELQSGDLVVVQRTRFQGSERELTVKELQYYPNRYELLPRSSDAKYKPIVVPHDHQANGDEMEVQIVGVVLSAVRTFVRRRK